MFVSGDFPSHLPEGHGRYCTIGKHNWSVFSGIRASWSPVRVVDPVLEVRPLGQGPAEPVPNASDPNASQLQLVSQLISFLSTEPQITCLSGCTSEVLQTIEQASIFKKGVEYPFRFKALSLPQVMHQKEGCVFGRIGFHTQLKYLIAFLSNSLDEPWMANCPELPKVRNMPIPVYVH